MYKPHGREDSRVGKEEISQDEIKTSIPQKAITNSVLNVKYYYEKQNRVEKQENTFYLQKYFETDGNMMREYVLPLKLKQGRTNKDKDIVF